MEQMIFFDKWQNLKKEYGNLGMRNNLKQYYMCKEEKRELIEKEREAYMLPHYCILSFTNGYCYDIIISPLYRVGGAVLIDKQTRKEQIKELMKADFEAFKKATKAINEKNAEEFNLDSVFSTSGFNTVTISSELLYLLCIKNKYEKNEKPINEIKNTSEYNKIERSKLKDMQWKNKKYYSQSNEKASKNAEDDHDSLIEVRFPMLVVFRRGGEEYAIEFNDSEENFEEYIFAIHALIKAVTDLWDHSFHEYRRLSDLKMFASINDDARDEIIWDERFKEWERAALSKYINRAVQFAIHLRKKKWENNPNNVNEGNYKCNIRELWEKLYNLDVGNTDVRENFFIKLNGNLEKCQPLLIDFDGFCYKYARGDKKSSGNNKKRNKKEEPHGKRDILNRIREIELQNLFLLLYIDKCRRDCHRSDGYKNDILKIIFLYYQLNCEGNPLTVKEYYKEHSDLSVKKLIEPVVDLLKEIKDCKDCEDMEPLRRELDSEKVQEMKLLRKLDKETLQKMEEMELLRKFDKKVLQEMDIDSNIVFLNYINDLEDGNSTLQDWKKTVKSYSNTLSAKGNEIYSEIYDKIKKKANEYYK